MKKVLFVSSAMPSRLGGHRRLLFNLLSFSRHFEVHLAVVPVWGSGRKKTGLPSSIKIAVFEPQGSAFDPLHLCMPMNMLRLGRLSSALPRLQEYIDRNGIDLAVMFTQDCSVAFRSLKVKAKIAEALDSHSLYYSSKMAANGDAASIAQGLVLPLLYGAVERALSSSYDRVVYVSHKDVESSAIEKSRLFISFDLRETLPRMNLGRRRHGVALLGRWVHPPNRDGLRKILPELRSSGLEADLLGPGLPKSMRLPPAVRPLGYVQDLAGRMSQTKVCLIPVYYGAGLQNKVFDALRFGCVVVTTPFTKQVFSSNGLDSDSIVAADDLAFEAKRQLGSWSPKKARQAYAAYRRLYALMQKNQQDYLALASKLAHGSFRLP